MVHGRYPVVIAATEQVPVPGIDEADPDTEPPAVVTFNVVSQPGLQRRQVYYPNISWRLSRVLQARSSTPHFLPPAGTCLIHDILTSHWPQHHIKRKV